MSDAPPPLPEETPAPAADGAAPAGDASPSPPPPPAATEPEAGPALARVPGWVPAAVVAGAVLALLGVVVHQVMPGGDGEAASSFVSDLGTVMAILGGLSLVAGYFGYLLGRVPVAAAFEALLLTKVTGFLYLLGAAIVLETLAGEESTLFFVEWFGWTGKGAKAAAILGALLCAGGFGAGFWLTTRLVWPYFRSAVALNVLLMVHLVVAVLGVVSFLNDRFTPVLLGTGIDLTETGRFTLSDKTRAVLDKVEGDLKVVLLDYRDMRRMQASNHSRRLDDVTNRVQGLLREYHALNSRIDWSLVNPLRNPQEVEKAVRELRMEDSLGSITGEEDALLVGYRPPGEKVFVRTRLVRLDAEFLDTSSLGTPRFRGEGILTNAMNEVVFVQRKVCFLEGHGGLALQSSAPTKSLSGLADALRGDNFAVEPLNLQKQPGIPEDADLVVVPGPQTPLAPAEVEALRAFLGRGGSLLVLVDWPQGSDPRTGLEELLASYGIRVRRDAEIVSFVVERTFGQGEQATAVPIVMAGSDELGRHPATEALARGSYTLAFFQAVPVFRDEKPPAGVEVRELVFAPRAVGDYRPFAAVGGAARPAGPRPVDGDITDRRLPVAVAAAKTEGETAKGGGRVVVVGDGDFATDLRLLPTSRAQVPANRTLLLNCVSWAVRRELIAVDPKTVETASVKLRPVDADLAFWVTGVALPLVALGLAVGVWWTRRR